MGDFLDAIRQGDRRKQLIALRDRLAEEIEASVKGADVAALALRLMKVLEELDGMPDSGRVSAYDELAAKRVGGDKNAARRQGGRRRRGSAG